MGVTTDRAGRWGWLAQAWAPLLVVAIGYAVFTLFFLRQFHFNPTGPIRIGNAMHGEQFWTESTYVHPDIGYDGQWYFYLAHDLLLRSPDPGSFLDLPAYRYARILYPTLAWALALGQPAAIPWSLLAVNLLGVLVGTVACVDVVRQLGGSRWLALGYAFSPPLMAGVSASLAEPTAFALVMAGIALTLRGRHRLAGVVLALGVLGREPSILVPVGFGLYALGSFDWKRGLSYLLPLAVPISWHLWIWARLGTLPSAQSPPNFGVPFGGAYYRLGLINGWHPPMLGEPIPTSNVLGESVIIVASALVIVVGLLKILERRDVFAWLFWLQALLTLGTGPLVWADLYSYGRVLGLLYLTFGLVLLTNPRRAEKLPARLREWTTDIPARTILVWQLSGPVTSSVTPAFPTMKRTEKQS